MGVPVFFKWLSMRNPKIIKDAHQAPHQQYDSGNPSIDNFYIDMNGLIHPSCNPKGQNIRQPSNFQQQCQNIFEYIDKLVNIVRPKKLIYLAIDGVAPRAKMNQQRSRRFRAAMEGIQMNEKKQKLLQQYKKVGAYTEELERYATKKNFDSNLITPGTQFLSAVCIKIRGYIQQRLKNHKLWRNNTVIFSDANVPGQGQHKIMEFIRQERSSQGYSANQSHCIYGADADLIMLSLATHEPRFYIIRQIVITANDKWCTSCGKRGHYFLDCIKANSIDGELKAEQVMNQGSINVNFQFIRIQMVRQYLHLHFHKCSINFGYNLQRIIDDFIFLCFFVGNDFLPHVPSLSIRDGGIDVLLRVYEYCLQIMPDYLTNGGQLNPQSLQILIKQMSYHEESIIQQMKAKEYSAKMRQNFQKNVENKFKGNKDNDRNKSDQLTIDYKDPLTSFKEELKKMMGQQFSLQDYSIFGHHIYSSKEKYYREKFRIKPSEYLELKHNINKAYIEALRWICLYYYKGVPSWSWFYPFHYSPFFSDMKVIKFQNFEEGEPFRPFQQLMAVLSPKTFYALPKDLHYLMLEPKSPICDYFPKQFVIDLVGKKFAWLGQVLLPFIDDSRLIKAMNNYQIFLTQEQQNRNRLGFNLMYISKYGKLGKSICGLVGQGGSLALTHQSNDCIEGQVQLLKLDGEIYEYRFIQPQKRIHSVSLKAGIIINALEELDDEYVTHTDKKAFGGQRFVRVIERVLGRRQNNLKRQYSREQDKKSGQNSRGNYNRRGGRNNEYSNESNQRKNRERSRSRQKRKTKIDPEDQNKRDYQQ